MKNEKEQQNKINVIEKTLGYSSENTQDALEIPYKINEEGFEITVRFSLGTGFAGSKITEDIKFEFEKETTREEIEKAIGEAYSDWVWDKIDGGWSIVS